MTTPAHTLPGSTLTLQETNEPHDIAACATIMEASDPWREHGWDLRMCAEGLTAPGVRAFMVRDGREACGVLAAMDAGLGGEPLLEFLCLRADIRGQGHGSRIIRFFEEELYPNAANLYLFVSDTNPHAMRLYVRRGYHQVGALPNFNFLGQTEFLLRKSRRTRLR